MVKDEDDVDSNTNKNAKLQWKNQTRDEGCDAWNQIRFLAPPHWFHHANFYHENYSSNDDASQSSLGDVEEVGREEQQRQNYQNT